MKEMQFQGPVVQKNFHGLAVGGKMMRPGFRLWLLNSERRPASEMSELFDVEATRTSPTDWIVTPLVPTPVRVTAVTDIAGGWLVVVDPDGDVMAMASIREMAAGASITYKQGLAKGESGTCYVEQGTLRFKRRKQRRRK